jgi:hypothetical protein
LFSSDYCFCDSASRAQPGERGHVFGMTAPPIRKPDRRKIFGNRKA